MVIYYKNSFLASLVSILASSLVLFSFAVFAEGSILVGILLIVAAVPLFAWAKHISKKKEFKKWWKQISEKGLEAQIASSVDTAVSIYKKNPQKFTLEAIRKLNPAAAAVIENKPVPASPAAKPAPQSAAAPQNAPVSRPVPAPQPAPAPQSAPVPRPAPAPQPAPAASAVRPAPQDVDTTLNRLIDTCNNNSTRDPNVYYSCMMQMEQLYALHPNHELLRISLAKTCINFASHASGGYDIQKKAADACLRAIELEPSAPQDQQDKRIFCLYLRSLITSIDAGDSSGTREQMFQARELLRTASLYRIQRPSPDGMQMMGLSFPVARCRIAYKLAKDLFINAPVQTRDALTMAEEALRFCPMDIMRQCDLNPFTKDNTTVILTRAEVQRLVDQLRNH